MGRLIRIFTLILFVLAGAFALTICSNPVDIVEKVTKEVLSANDRYLEVTAILPKNADVGVDPNGAMVITFDRAVEATSIKAGNLVVRRTSTGEVLSLEFPVLLENEGRSVRFYPETYFENSTMYTITLSGITGAEGEKLSDPFESSFTTGVAPAGNLAITSTNGLSEEGFTNTATVNLTLTLNDFVSGYYISQSDLSGVDPAVLPEGGWKDDSILSIPNVTLADTSQGAKSIWVLFRQAVTSGYQYSSSKASTIVYDSLSPVVYAGGDIITNTVVTTSPSVSDAHIAHYAWSLSSGAALTWGDAGEEHTSISAATDGDRVLTLTVSDRAGNSSSDSLNYSKDTVAPVVSMGSAIYTKTTTSLSPTVTELHPGSFAWSLLSGSAVSFGSPANKNTTVSASIEGLRLLRLTAKDAAGNSGYSNLYWTWDVSRPVVEAGQDVIATAGVNLDGSATDNLSPLAYAWSLDSGSAVAFGTSAAEDTTVSTAVDGTRVLRLTVTDSAGNSAYDTMTYSYDASPVLAPAVASSSAITLDGTPEWTWTSGGNGNASFRYSWDNLNWTATASTSFTPESILSDGIYTLYVGEHDAVYNYYSQAGSRSVRVTKVIPYSGARSVSKTPTLSWRGTITAMGYTVQVFSGKLWVDYATTGTATSLVVTTPLASTTEYTWRVAVSSKAGTSYIPSSSGASFITGL